MITFLFPILLLANFATAREKPTSCFGRPDIQAQQSERLKKLAAEDQADRSVPFDSIDWNKVGLRDLKRRMEVGKLLGQGCITSAQDYANAAIIYQHGDTADHAYQAFIWSLKGVELGDASQKWLLGAALDRYLVRAGHMQLFATQFSRPQDEKCWCLEETETSFPDSRRAEYNKPLSAAEARVSEMNKDLAECNKIVYCKQRLKPTPAGKVPGFW